MSSKEYNNFIGLHFIADIEDGTCVTGQVVRFAAPGVFFVRFDSQVAPMPLELVSIQEMLEVNREGYKLWHFFDTIDEREKWMAWEDTPSKPRVVSLVRPTS